MLNKFCALSKFQRWLIAIAISMLGCVIVFAVIEAMGLKIFPTLTAQYVVSLILSVYFGNRVVRETSLKTTVVYIAHVTGEAIVIFDNKSDNEAIDTVLKKKPPFTRKDLYLIRAGSKVRECKETDFKG